MIHCEFRVSGLVQGVGFRFYIYRKALENSVAGYTKNEYDGSVVIIAEGLPENMELIESYIKRGPSRSRVDSFTKTYHPYTGKFSGFEIK